MRTLFKTSPRRKNTGQPLCVLCPLSNMTTPLRFKASSVHRFGFILPNNEDLRRDYARDMALHWYAFVPSPIFKGSYMDEAKIEAPSALFPPIDDDVLENVMQIPFVSTMAPRLMQYLRLPILLAFNSSALFLRNDWRQILPLATPQTRNSSKQIYDQTLE